MAALYQRALANDPPMTARDLALAIELNQQYVDILSEMEDMPMSTDESVTVEVNEKPIRFTDIDKLADWLAEVMD